MRRILVSEMDSLINVLDSLHDGAAVSELDSLNDVVGVVLLFSNFSSSLAACFEDLLNVFSPISRHLRRGSVVEQIRQNLCHLCTL